ncbi:hypothetical protein RFI_11445, partial [Reticulomyxa filosa]
EDGSFGLIEGLIELVSAIGSMLPSLFPMVFVMRKSFMIIWLSSLLIGSVLFISIFAQPLQSAIMSYICNVLAFGIYSFQNALAYACIAFSLKGSNYVTIFTIASFLGLLVTTIIELVGEFTIWSTTGYYIAAIATQYVVCILLLFRVQWGDNKYYLALESGDLSLHSDLMK